MPYMLLIVEPVGQRQERGRELGEQVYARMLDYTAELQREGVLMNSSSLASTAEATRLQLREGRRSIVDGPFAEAKEMVGGFFLLNVATREEVLAAVKEAGRLLWRRGGARAFFRHGWMCGADRIVPCVLASQLKQLLTHGTLSCASCFRQFPHPWVPACKPTACRLACSAPAPTHTGATAWTC